MLGDKVFSFQFTSNIIDEVEDLHQKEGAGMEKDMSWEVGVRVTEGVWRWPGFWGFVREEKDFQLNLWCNRKPVEVLWDMCGDVFTEVLDVLKFIKNFGQRTVKNVTAVVESGGNESMDQG